MTEDTSSARPFSVDGSTFLNLSAACGRACDVQHKCVPPGDVGVIVVYVRMPRTLADRTLLSGIVILRILLVKPQILRRTFCKARRVYKNQKLATQIKWKGLR